MTTTNNADLAARMRDARKRAGLKQRDLAHIASRSQIGRIERGEVYAPETIDAWAAACGVSAEWLRTGVEAAPESADSEASTLRAQLAEAEKQRDDWKRQTEEARLKVDPTNDLRWAVVRGVQEELVNAVVDTDGDVPDGVVRMAAAALRAVVPGVGDV